MPHPLEQGARADLVAGVAGWLVVTAPLRSVSGVNKALKDRGWRLFRDGPAVRARRAIAEIGLMRIHGFAFKQSVTDVSGNCVSANPGPPADPPPLFCARP